MHTSPIQPDLFDTRPWTPEPKPRRKTHMDLFFQIQRMALRPAGCFARLKYFSVQFSVCVRTIKNWLKILREKGLLKLEHHGPKGAVMKVLRALAPIIAPFKKRSSILTLRDTHTACVEKKRPETPKEPTLAERVYANLLAKYGGQP